MGDRVRRTAWGVRDGPGPRGVRSAGRHRRTSRVAEVGTPFRGATREEVRWTTDKDPGQVGSRVGPWVSHESGLRLRYLDSKDLNRERSSEPSSLELLVDPGSG